MADQLKIVLTQQVADIPLASREKIIKTEYIMAF